MAIWPFNRRRTVVTDSTLPPEVQAYNNANHHERMGIAWLVGVISLIVSAAVLAGLFFGGRWVYRKIAGNDKKNTTSQTQKNGNDKDNGNNSSDKSKDSNDQTNGQSSGQAANGNSQDHNATTTPTPTPTPTPTDNTNLVRTGPDEDL